MAICIAPETVAESAMTKRDGEADVPSLSMGPRSPNRLRGPLRDCCPLAT